MFDLTSMQLVGEILEGHFLTHYLLCHFLFILKLTAAYWFWICLKETIKLLYIHFDFYVLMIEQHSSECLTWIFWYIQYHLLSPGVMSVCDFTGCIVDGWRRIVNVFPMICLLTFSPWMEGSTSYKASHQRIWPLDYIMLDKNAKTI